jgi:hypothetical protein
MLVPHYDVSKWWWLSGLRSLNRLTSDSSSHDEMARDKDIYDTESICFPHVVAIDGIIPWYHAVDAASRAYFSHA